MADKKFVFDFKIEKDDYRKSVMCITFGSQKWKRILLIVVWIAAAITFVLNLLGVVELSSPMYACCLMVTIALASVWITTQISIFKYRDVYKKGKGIKRRISFDDKGVTFTNLSNNDFGFSPWEEIHRFQETADSYIIGVGSSDAVILPKRAILLNKDVRDFERFVQDHIQGRFMPM